jgi:hypothetical protein
MTAFDPKESQPPPGKRFRQPNWGRLYDALQIQSHPWKFEEEKSLTKKQRWNRSELKSTKLFEGAFGPLLRSFG